VGNDCPADVLEPPGATCTDDSNECTDDECDGAGACVHSDNIGPCDDQNTCTTDDACGAGSCISTPSTVCDEGVDDTLPPGGGTVTTDIEADGATPDDQVETTLTTPLEGVYTIAEKAGPGGFLASATAQDATAQDISAQDNNPFKTRMRVDPARPIAGNSLGNLRIFRGLSFFRAADDAASRGSALVGGTLVDDCAGAPGVADPDPCVADRATLGDGDVEVFFLSTTQGQWALTGFGGCALQPLDGCLAAAKAAFQIRDNADDAKDQLKWKWGNGDETVQSDLGDPSNSTAYTLCVYDSTLDISSLAATLLVDVNGNWQDKDPKGWNYKDKVGLFAGVQKAQLKTGAPTKSKAQVKAKGAGVPVPTAFSTDEFFDQDSAVTVQLVSSDGTCWTSEFAANKKNTAEQFKAKAP